MGWRTPCSRIDAARSLSVSWCHVIRGWEGFGTTRSSGMSRTAVGVRAARRLMIPGWASFSWAKMRFPASRNDLRPRGTGGAAPRLLVSTDHLLGQVDEALRRVGTGLVHGDRDARGGRLADLHGLADDGLEDLVIAQVPERIEQCPSQDPSP